MENSNIKIELGFTKTLSIVLTLIVLGIGLAFIYNLYQKLNEGFEFFELITSDYEFIYESFKKVFLVFILIKLYLALDLLVKGSIYSKELYRRLKNLGFISLFAGVINFLARTIHYTYISDHPGPRVIFSSENFAFLIFVIGLVLLSSAEIMRVGILIKQENELTV